jgi:uncharacterized membrane protein
MVSFELLLMSVLIPAGAILLDKPIAEIGVLGAVLSAKAMLLGLAYNWAFDQVDARAGRISSQRSHVGRIMHALGFEVSLTLTSLPFYVFWLQISVLEALAADIVITSFVVAYTYAFTLAYDKTFPVQQRLCLAQA